MSQSVAGTWFRPHCRNVGRAVAAQILGIPGFFQQRRERNWQSFSFNKGARNREQPEDAVRLKLQERPPEALIDQEAHKSPVPLVARRDPNFALLDGVATVLKLMLEWASKTASSSLRSEFGVRIPKHCFSARTQCWFSFFNCLLHYGLNMCCTQTSFSSLRL